MEQAPSMFQSSQYQSTEEAQSVNHKKTLKVTILNNKAEKIEKKKINREVSRIYCNKTNQAINWSKQKGINSSQK